MSNDSPTTPAHPELAETKPEPQRRHSLSVLLVVGIGTFLTALAGSTINLGLPELSREYEAGLVESRWVIQSFMLTVGVLLLIAGRAADIFGHRRLYLIGFSLFGVASLACGMAPSFSMLIVFRILQGVGSAMVMATGPALLTTNVPKSRRGQSLGLLSTATYLGLTAGPPLGGVLVAMGGWRWTFFINVPVCVLVFILGLRMLPVPPKPRAQRFDSMGAALLLLAMPALLLGLSEGPSWGWQDPWVIAFLLTGLVGMALFLRSQHRKSSPLLQLELFTSRIFCGAAISAVANYIALFSVIILMPFVLEEGMRCSPLCTGMLLAAQPAIMAIVASPAGWLSDRIGSRLLATVGMSVLTGGLLLLATLGQDSSLWMYAGSLAVVGLGTGIFISPNSSALMGAAPRHLQGTASSILGEARTLGMLLGVTLGSGVYALWGGQTGTSWQAGDFGAMRAVMFAAAAVAATGALAAALRGKRTSSSVTQANT